MYVPNETIMNIAIAATLRTDRVMSIRDVFISVHLFEPKFPIEWFSCSISWCLSVSKKWTDATAPCRAYANRCSASSISPELLWNCRLGWSK